MKKRWATVEWSIDDITNLRPEWTREKAEEFLDINEKIIQDKIEEMGRDFIETLLDF